MSKNKPKTIKRYADAVVYKLPNGSYSVQLIFFGGAYVKHEGATLVFDQRIEWEEEE